MLLRSDILDMCIPHTTAGHKRRAELERDLNGDWTHSSIDLFVPDAGTEFDLEVWADRTSTNMFPVAWDIFPRHRWLTKTQCIREAALLSLCHDLFSPTVKLYTPKAKTKTASSPNRAHRAPKRASSPNRAHHAWDIRVDSNSDDSSQDGVQPDLDRARGPRPNEDWAEFNSRQRGDTSRFAASQPAAELMVACKVLAPPSQVDAAHVSRELCSLDFGTEAQSNARGGAHLHTDAAGTFTRVHQQVFQGNPPTTQQQSMA